MEVEGQIGCSLNCSCLRFSFSFVAVVRLHVNVNSDNDEEELALPLPLPVSWASNQIQMSSKNARRAGHFSPGQPPG